MLLFNNLNLDSARLGHDAAAKKDVEDRHAAAVKEWEEASASGLNLAAANQRDKSLCIMLVHDGQKRFKQRLPHVRITDLHFGDLWRHLDDVVHIARNITVERVTLFSRMHEPQRVDRAVPFSADRTSR